MGPLQSHCWPVLTGHLPLLDYNGEVPVGADGSRKGQAVHIESKEARRVPPGRAMIDSCRTGSKRTPDGSSITARYNPANHSKAALVTPESALWGPHTPGESQGASSFRGRLSADASDCKSS